MSKKLKKWAAILVLMMIAQSLLAQIEEPVKQDQPTIPFSILRVGFSPVNLMQSRYLSPGFTVDWEKPLNAHVTVGVNLYRDLTQCSRFHFDQTEYHASGGSQLFLLNDIRSSLSLNLNYYFKANAFDGLYLSYRLHNVFTEIRQYDAARSDGGSTRWMSQPRRGFYVGYRKVFDRGFFVDASAGVVPTISENYDRRVIGDFLDFKFTLGWQIGWRKDKKRRRK